MNVNGSAVISRRVEFVLAELRVAAALVQHKEYQSAEISAGACYRGMLSFLRAERPAGPSSAGSARRVIPTGQLMALGLYRQRQL